MCYEVKCNKCGKTSWGGCGRHVPGVYQRIPEGQHCRCRDWPGVKLSSASDSAASAAAAAGGSSGDGDKAAETSQPSAAVCNVM